MNDINIEKPILIVDDEPFVREILSDFLGGSYACITAESGSDALAKIRENSFSVVISDIDLGDANGIEIVPQIVKSSPDTVVLMISGNQTIDYAIRAIRVGAFDYITKPFELDFVEIAVARAFEHHVLLAGKREYENRLEQLVKDRTDRLEHLSYHDALTDLPNRFLFEDRLSQALLVIREDEKPVLLMLSIDDFKKIQETLGHTAGDSILQIISEKLKEQAGDKITLSRFQGDVFAILLTDFGSPDDIVSLAERINEAVKKPVTYLNNEVFLTASIGIAVCPNDGQDAETLLKNAGAALSRAREQGGDRYEFHESGMNATAIKRLTMESDLRQALTRREFEIFYQPKVSVDSGAITGMEALVRWRHPEFGIVPPDDFIALAEETGLIIPIGELVLCAACEQTRLWRDDGFDLNVAVNLSARQFRSTNLAESVMRILNETGFNASRLNLEITESSIMRDAESAVKTLGVLKNLGISISLDDFGTGYSSLAYLKRLPIDVLKIDKAFIDDVTTDPDGASLAMAMVTLAHNLRLTVVAEGVETAEQLKFLSSIRCDTYQGYLFSKPVAAYEFYRLMQTSVLQTA